METYKFYVSSHGDRNPLRVIVR